MPNREKPLPVDEQMKRRYEIVKQLLEGSYRKKEGPFSRGKKPKSPKIPHPSEWRRSKSSDGHRQLMPDRSRGRVDKEDAVRRGPARPGKGSDKPKKKNM